MSLGWVFSNYIHDIKNKYITKNPVSNKPSSPDKKKRMKKNNSIDDFMKHHVPWIL
jgi:hypothetical protein